MSGGILRAFAGAVKSPFSRTRIMKRVLVVDDEVPLRGTIREVLESGDFQVSEAGDGKEALELVEKVRPDLVIMDIIMPEKEGIETIFEIQRDYPEVNIVAISGGGLLPPEEYLSLAKGMKIAGTVKILGASPEAFDISRSLKLN